MTVNVQSTGLSLLRPTVTLYAADQSTVLGTATAAGSYNGGNLTVSYTTPGLLGLGLGTVAGQTFYVKVTGADGTAFGTGAYDLNLNMGLGGLLPVSLPTTPLLNGSIFSGGNGAAEVTNSTAETSDFYEINANAGPGDSAPVIAPASGTPAHGQDSTTSNVAVAALSPPAAVVGANPAGGPTSAASVQGLTQIALVLAPPSSSTQMGNSHLAVPQNVAVAAAVAQIGQAGPQQTAPVALSVIETHTASPGVATAAVTVFEDLTEENEAPAPERIPTTPAPDVALRQQAADAVFADPNLTEFGLRQEGDGGLDDVFAGSVLVTEPVSEAAPAATSPDEEASPSGALAGLALFGGWWLTVSGLAEPRSQTKRPLQK